MPARRAGRPPKVDDDTLLTAALRVFSDYGYDGMSVRVLNRALGISHNTIHQRFGSKERLWYAAVDYGFSHLRRTLTARLGELRAAADPLDILRELVVAFLHAAAEQPHLVRLMNYEGCHDTPRITYIYETHMAPLLAPATAALRALHSAALIRPISVRAFHFLMAHGAAAPFTLTSLAAQFDVTEGPFDVEAHIEMVANLLVGGLRKI